MATFRTILACLIALAVALAPAAATVIAAARPASAASVHDCHRMAAGHYHGHARADGATSQHSHGSASQVTEKGGSCPDCDAKRHAKCIGDGGKCCKLTGMVAALPAVMVAAEVAELAANPPTLTGREIRPPPPPPRA